MKLSVGQFVEIEQLGVARTIAQQASRTLPQPRTAFDGQDLSGLLDGLSAASLTAQDQGIIAPPATLNLYTIDNGIFFVGHQLDGTILTEDGRPVHQTAAFRSMQEAGRTPRTILDLPEPALLDEVFVGFDGAWRNYFHWMCFALTKSFLAARHLHPRVIIALPDYKDACQAGPISFGEKTWQQSIDFSGLGGRVTALPSGVYCARKLHFFWTTPREPTDIMLLEAFTAVFDAMLGHAQPVPATFENIHLARARTVTSRIAEEPGEILARVMARHGFRTIGFENADLRQQISIFANAKRVVSPHGAGLTNTLFNRRGLRVLELNKPLDGGSAFRPWFFVTAAIRNHRYATLDSDMAGLAEAHIESAIAALDG